MLKIVPNIPVTTNILSIARREKAAIKTSATMIIEKMTSLILDGRGKGKMKGALFLYSRYN